MIILLIRFESDIHTRSGRSYALSACWLKQVDRDIIVSGVLSRISEAINHASAVQAILGMFGVTSLTGGLAYFANIPYDKIAYIALVVLLSLIAINLCFMLGEAYGYRSSLGARHASGAALDTDDKSRRLAKDNGYLTYTVHKAQRVKVGEYFDASYNKSYLRIELIEIQTANYTEEALQKKEPDRVVIKCGNFEGAEYTFGRNVSTTGFYTFSLPKNEYSSGSSSICALKTLGSRLWAIQISVPYQ
jgi:hypothetical protein